MLQERDRLAIGGDARMTDPAGTLAQDLADRIFESVLATYVANDGEVLAIGRPVGPLHPLEDVARVATVDGHPSQSAGLGVGPGGGRFGEQSDVAGRRDAHQLLAVTIEGTRLRALGAGDEELGGLTLPGRAVDHRLAIRGESRGADRAATEGELL